ncbi:MAG: M15 family metallopeptidase [Nannocystaceae bacterium]|nr:M15 family metallopeptidase [Nannocystaceae bacterium]
MTPDRVGLLLSVCVLGGCAQSYFASGGTDGETETDSASGSTRGVGEGTQDSGTRGSSSEDGADTWSQSGGSDTSGSSGTSGGTTAPACGDGVDVYEDDSMAVCPPAETTTERIVQCLCAYDPPLLEAAARPLDATDPLYYANRWYSIDPCFPFTPPSSLLANVRETYINAVDDLEPEMLEQCGDYEVEMVQLPPAFTNDDDQLLSYAWTSSAPEEYPETLNGEPVGLDGQVGFAPMFAAAAQAGIGLFVQSGFRSMETQADLFEYYAGVEGDPSLAAVYSAWPAHSEHQLGTTADVGYLVDGAMVSPFDPLEAELHASDAFVWIRANAHRFGIVTTYQPRRVHVHQYKPEPWHLRFVGVEAADLMTSCGLSTEELLAYRYRVQPQPEFMHMDLVYDAVLGGGWDPETCAD